MSNFINHLKTIHTHRKYVRKACFKMGIPFQGIVHDLSKYSLTELSIIKYYNGKESPHDVCRKINGYSPCWMHHYHKNKHHWEYWLDNDSSGHFVPIKMPFKYVIESVCDMIGASKAYNKSNWNYHMPLQYWNSHHNDDRFMHKDSLALTKFLITKLDQLGEQGFYKFYKINKKYLKTEYVNHKSEKEYDNIVLISDRKFKKLEKSLFERFDKSYTQIPYSKAKELLDNSNIETEYRYRDGGSLFYKTTENIEIIFPVANFSNLNSFPVYSPIALYKKTF